MKKKLLALTLVFTLCIGTSMTVCAAPKATQVQSETQFSTTASASELATIKKLFNAKDYAAMYPDVAKAYGNDEKALWNHFVKYGLSEGRSLSRNFNVFAYRSAYKDLQKAFGNDLIEYYLHYANYGIKEKRPITTTAQAVKAGITVTGFRGQVVAKPAPVEEKTTAKPSSTTSTTITEKKNETAEVTEKPKPSVAPTSKPSDGSCEHDYYYVSSENSGKHYQKCRKCGNKKPEESCVLGSNGTCTYCTPQHSHRYQNNYSHISGTDTDARVCEDCGYIDTNSPINCSAGDNGYQTEGDYHWQICVRCGERINYKKHSFSYTMNNTEHWDGKCTTCNKQDESGREHHCFEVGSNVCTKCGTSCTSHDYQNGRCSNCGNEHAHTYGNWTSTPSTHQRKCSGCDFYDTGNHTWDSNGNCTICHRICNPHSYNNGTCSECGNVHIGHDWDASNQICKICEKVCEHSFGSWTSTDNADHQRTCGICGYTAKEAHNYSAGVICEICGYNNNQTP